MWHHFTVFLPTAPWAPATGASSCKGLPQGCRVRCARCWVISPCSLVSRPSSPSCFLSRGIQPDHPASIRSFQLFPQKCYPFPLYFYTMPCCTFIWVSAGQPPPQLGLVAPECGKHVCFTPSIQHGAWHRAGAQKRGWEWTEVPAAGNRARKRPCRFMSTVPPGWVFPPQHYWHLGPRCPSWKGLLRPAGHLATSVASAHWTPVACLTSLPPPQL